jgi:hypothetical protein
MVVSNRPLPALVSSGQPIKETKMITFARSADIKDGKGMAAVEWALKVTSYLNKNFDMDTQLMQNVTGAVNQLHWVTTFDSLASLEVAIAKLNEDEGYLQHIAEANEMELFHGGSIVDHLYRTIP